MNPYPCTIRDASLEDASAIAALEQETSERYSPEYWRELLSTAAYPMLSFCAESEDQVVGFVIAQIRIGESGLAEESGWLTKMAVARSHQRNGIGRMLLNALRTRLVDLGIHELCGLASYDSSGLLFLRREGFDVRPDLVAVRLGLGSDDPFDAEERPKS